MDQMRRTAEAGGLLGADYAIAESWSIMLAACRFHHCLHGPLQ